MNEQNSRKIRDVIYDKYGFDVEPSVDGALIVMNEDLTVGEFINIQNELKNGIENVEIGLDINKAVGILGGPPFRKLPILSVFFYNFGWTITLVFSTIFFFFNWIYGIVFLIGTIKEFLAPFNRKIFRNNIIKLALNDYETLYLLMCSRSISIREYE